MYRYIYITTTCDWYNLNTCTRQWTITVFDDSWGLLEFSHSENSPIIRQRRPRLRNLQLPRSPLSPNLTRDKRPRIRDFSLDLVLPLVPASGKWASGAKRATSLSVIQGTHFAREISGSGSDRRCAPRYATGRRRAALVFETRERRYLPVA